jgi:flagellar biogenesis protein FliO
MLSRTLALALLLVGAWALVRLWHRDSSAYIRHQSAPTD